MTDDIEASKTFWNDHVARLSLGRPLLDPYAAGLMQGRKLNSLHSEIINYALFKVINDLQVPTDIRARAHKAFIELRDNNGQD